MHVYFHTSLTHKSDHVPPASIRVWPAAFVCVSMRTTMCVHVHVFAHVHRRVRVTVLHCRWDSCMCQLCTCVLQGKMYWESKSVRGMGSHASIFSIAKTLLSILPPHLFIHTNRCLKWKWKKEASHHHILSIQYSLEIKWVVARGLLGICWQFEAYERKILCVYAI